MLHPSWLEEKINTFEETQDEPEEVEEEVEIEFSNEEKEFFQNGEIPDCPECYDNEDVVASVLSNGKTVYFCTYCKEKWE